MKIAYVVCFLAIVAQAFGECVEGCDQPILFYKGLGCKPIYTSADDCCPAKFDCSFIAERATKKRNVCYFHGKTYAIGETVNDDETYGNCQLECFCNNERADAITQFTCVHTVCRSRNMDNKPGCRGKYEHDKCCPVADVCPPFNVTCQVGVETYHEGQYFPAPNKKCVNCICDKGFVGKLEEPYCKEVTCIDEIKYQEKVYEFCAPTYDSSANCCPTSWLCPDGNEIIKSPPTDSDRLDKCKFGNTLLNVGDIFEKELYERKHAVCECRIPPYVTCFEKFIYH